MEKMTRCLGLLLMVMSYSFAPLNAQTNVGASTSPAQMQATSTLPASPSPRPVIQPSTGPQQILSQQPASITEAGTSLMNGTVQGAGTYSKLAAAPPYVEPEKQFQNQGLPAPTPYPTNNTLQAKYPLSKAVNSSNNSGPTSPKKGGPSQDKLLPAVSANNQSSSGAKSSIKKNDGPPTSVSLANNSTLADQGSAPQSNNLTDTKLSSYTKQNITPQIQPNQTSATNEVSPLASPLANDHNLTSASANPSSVKSAQTVGANATPSGELDIAMQTNSSSEGMSEAQSYLNRLIAAERFNMAIESNAKDDLLTEEVLNRLKSSSKVKLSNYQLSNQTTFLDSLTSEQKIILESKLKSLVLTPTQQQLERNYLGTFVSERTKAANQAGFDAIKKGLTPDVQKTFDASEGIKSLQLTEEQKYRFAEGSREFLEDPGAYAQSGTGLNSIRLPNKIIFFQASLILSGSFFLIN